MALPSNAVFRSLYRYSVSKNIYSQIVKPLAVFLHGDEPEHRDVKDLKGELIELHKCLWHERTPLEYSGAVAGRFEELLYALRIGGKQDGTYIKVGAEGRSGEQKKGGDITIVKTDGRTITCQLKVSNSARQAGLIEHLNKAGAQLTGETGERPETGSEKVIVLLVQNTEAFEAYGLQDWKSVVDSALSQDYTSDNRTVAAETIRKTVDVVKIVTQKGRFKFVVNNGVIEMPYNAFKELDDVKKFAFTGNRINQHWDWLRRWYADTILTQADPARSALIRSTKNDGVGGAGAYADLPKWDGPGA